MFDDAAMVLEEIAPEDKTRNEVLGARVGIYMAAKKPLSKTSRVTWALAPLELLGLFFVLDRISGFLVFLDEYAKTSSWAILVAVSALVVSHILGLTSSLAVESALRLQPILTPELFAQTTASRNEPLIRR